MIKVYRFKKLFARLMLSTFILSMSATTFTSLANGLEDSLNGNTTGILEEIKTGDKYKQLDTEDGEDATEDEDSATLRDALVDKLNEELDTITSADNGKVSIATGTLLINKVCIAAKAPVTFS
ncbi:MAG: hypothetical protein K6F00_06755, partial [Lachnospiraceae bacterium]|nr:hypothetical protein [Lachnospiraceae bacterium]